MVELGHEGHQGDGGTKRLLRTRLWFPGMDEKVERKVRECLGCQASTKENRRDPLQPTEALKEPCLKACLYLITSFGMFNLVLHSLVNIKTKNQDIKFWEFCILF